MLKFRPAPFFLLLASKARASGALVFGALELAKTSSALL